MKYEFCWPETGWRPGLTKLCIDFIMFHFNIRRKLSLIRLQYIILRYGWEPILIQRILICFEAILKKSLLSSVWGADSIAECRRLTSSTFPWILSILSRISSTYEYKNTVMLSKLFLYDKLLEGGNSRL